MSEYDKYMKAARNAHDAGDFEAARRLVGLAKKSKQGDNVIAETADGGRVYRMQDGSLSFASPNYSTTDQDTIKRLMQGDGVKEVVQSTTDQLRLEGNPLARFNEVARGTIFGGSYLDEAMGLISPEAQKEMRLDTAAMQREKPGQTAALNIGGAITSAIAASRIPGVDKALSSIMPASRAGRAAVGGLLGAAGGGTEGLVYGYGEGETPDERQSAASEQGKIGTAFGAVGGAAADTVADIFKALRNRWVRSDVDQIAEAFKVSKDSARVLKRAFEQNDQTAFERITRAGSEATLADAGRSGQALLDAAASTGGRALNTVDAATTARANRSLSTVTDALDDALGEVMGPRAAARQVSEATRADRAAAYRSAYGTPIDYSDGGAGQRVLRVLGGLDARQVQEAADIANAKIKWRVSQGELPENFGRQLLVEVADDGSWRFAGDLPNVAQLDELKKALNQMDQAGRDMFGRATDGGLAGDQARAVRDATIDATGGPEGTYARAVKIGGDKVEMDRGLELGLDMLRNTKQTTREMVSESLQGMSADARAMVKRGLRAHIDEVIANTRAIASDPDGMEARQAMAALRELTTDAARDKLRILLGPEDFNKLMPKVDEAVSSQAMKAAVARNSATAVRQSLQGEVDDIVSPGVIGQLKRGEPVDATRVLTQELLNTTKEADAARKEQIWSEVAQVLSQRRGSKSAQAALTLVEKAIAGQPIKEAEAQLIASQVVLGLPFASGRSGNQALSTP